MAPITEIFFQFWNPKKYTFWIVLVCVLLLIGAIYIYYSDFFRVRKNAQLSDIPNAAGRDGSVVILFFFADWCPHCTKARGPWNDFVASYDGKTINNIAISCEEFDCSDSATSTPKTKNAIQRYNIEGFPTIKMLKGDQVIDFDAQISAFSLKKFVQDMS